MGKIEEDQDGLALIKLLQDITFHKDGSKQSMMELVESEKSLYSCFQRKENILEIFTSKFKVRVQACEPFDLNIGATKAAAIILAVEDGVDFRNTTNKEKWTSYVTQATTQYQASIHFNWLNNVIYKRIKAKGKKNWAINGLNIVLCYIPKIIKG